MNIKSVISQKLWDSVSTTYSSENYSHAIVDGMHLLTDIIREKSNVDGDGVGLVGQAFGGDDPKLRLTRMQTETDRDIQKGMENLLRGMYLLIRNPRSHEQIKDEKETADTILIFINYIIGIIEKAEEPYSIEKFIKRIYDPDFVFQERYVSLLVKEIPERHLPDTLIEIYRKRIIGEGKRLGLLVREIRNRISYELSEKLFLIISEDLKIINNPDDIITILNCISPDDWFRINEIARMRIENKVINSLKKGSINRKNAIESEGLFALQLKKYIKVFGNRLEIEKAIINKVNDDPYESERYIMLYLINDIPNIIIEQANIDILLQVLADGIRRGDSVIKANMKKWMENIPIIWRNKIIELLQDLTKEDDPLFRFSDGTPLLSSEHEEIPF
jgi:uncharacterized protein (TIGR02391 family)